MIKLYSYKLNLSCYEVLMKKFILFDNFYTDTYVTHLHHLKYQTIYISFSVIPFPKNLVLERQLGSSVVITWQPPDGVAPQDVRVYHVCLDGKVIITVKGNERTKSLIENVDCNQV